MLSVAIKISSQNMERNVKVIDKCSSVTEMDRFTVFGVQPWLTGEVCVCSSSSVGVPDCCGGEGGHTSAPGGAHQPGLV